MYYIEYDRIKYLLYSILCFVLLILCFILLFNFETNIVRKIYTIILMIGLTIGMIVYLYYFMTSKPFMVISPHDISIKHPGFPGITIQHRDIVSIHYDVEVVRELYNRYKKKKKKQFLYIEVTNDLLVQKQIPFRQRDRFRRDVLSSMRTFKFPVEDVNHRMEDILQYLSVYLNEKVKISKSLEKTI